MGLGKFLGKLRDKLAWRGAAIGGDSKTVLTSSVKIGAQQLKKFSTLALLCLLPAVAEAGNAVDTVLVTKERNATSVAIRAIVKGDDNNNATAQILWRYIGAANYDTGFVMVKRTTRTFEGRILWIPEGQSIQYYVKTVDPNNAVDKISAVDTVTALRVPQRLAQATNYYVHQATGSDSNDGLSPFTPKKTIQSAVTALVAADPPTGSAVLVGQGEYHEQVILTAPATAGKSYALRAWRPHAVDSTIICGAHELLETGQYAPGQTLSWSVVTSSKSTDSLYRAYLPAASGPADSINLIVIGYGELIHRKTSVWGIAADSMGWKRQSYENPERSGWFWKNDSLYVKRSNGQSPGNVGIYHFGYRDNLIDVRAPNWRIENLTLRYGGGLKNNTTYPAAANPGMNGALIRLYYSGANEADNTVIDGCKFFYSNFNMIYSPEWAGGKKIDNVTVTNCTFNGGLTGAFPYEAGKSRSEEQYVGIKFDGRAWNIYKNTIHGSFNGIDGGGNTTDTTAVAYSEISYNTFRNIADDAVELENSPCINTLLLRNDIWRCATGISVAPVKTGPYFVFYNSVGANARGLKVGADAGTTQLGIVYVYHNTFTYSGSYAGTATYSVQYVGSGTHPNIYYSNNIYDGKATNNFLGPNEDAYNLGGYDYSNYNLFNTYNSTYIYKISTDDINESNTMCSLTGIDCNSVDKTGTSSESLFATHESSMEPNLRLESGITFAGYGKRIAGVNTGPGYNRYSTDIYQGAYDLSYDALPTWYNWFRRRRG